MTYSKRSIRTGIYLVSSLQSGAFAVSAGISDMARAFPDVPVQLVQMLLTIPVLIQMPITLMADQITEHFSKKRLLIFACICFVAGGLVPFFVHVFPVIMAMRCVYGIGIGLTLPLGASLVTDYFDGEERANVIGIQTAVGFMGGVFFNYIGGVLTAVSWEYCFLAYLYGLLVLCVVLRGLPDEGPVHRDAAVSTGARVHVPVLSVVMALNAMIYMILYFTYVNHISLFVDRTGLGNSVTTGISGAIINLCGFAGGALFGKMHRRFGNWTLCISLSSAAAGFVLLTNTYAVPTLFAASVLMGYGNGSFFPVGQNVISAVTDRQAVTLALSINVALSVIGQFISLLIFDVVGASFGLTDARTIMRIGMIGLMVMLAVSVPFAAWLQKKQIR